MMSYKAQEPLGETLLTVQWVVLPGSSWRSTAVAQLMLPAVRGVLSFILLGRRYLCSWLVTAV